MSRFENLEFEGKQKARAGAKAAVTTGTPIRDAVYFRSQADEAFRARRLEQALQNYAKALERDNSMFECWLGQVRILIELGEYKEANLWADKAMELFPDNPEMLAAKAVSAARMGNVDRALAFSDHAMSKQGVTPYVWLSRGEILLLRRSRMADGCFGKAIEGTTGDDRVWAQIEAARLYRRYHRFSQATLYAQAAAQAMPDCSAAWLELGLCQAGLGFKEALRSFHEALTLDPNNIEARHAVTRFQHRGLRVRIGNIIRRVRGK